MAAIAAPLNAPAERADRCTSGTMSRSSSARSIPTWLTAWLPPPESTNAVRGVAAPALPELADRVLNRAGSVSSVDMRSHLVGRARRTVCPAAERPELCCARNQPPTPHASFQRGGGRPTRERVLPELSRGRGLHRGRPADGRRHARRRPAPAPATGPRPRSSSPTRRAPTPSSASASRTSATTCTPCSS